MSISPTDNRQLKFADLLIDAAREEVYRGKETVQLPKLSYLLLKVLADNAPLTLSHEVLISTVWADKVVGDETLKQRIKLLRKSLADEAQSPKYIGVVRGRGYRLLPEVSIILLKPSTVSKYELSFNERVPDLSSAAGMKIWKRMSISLSFILVCLIGILFVMGKQLDDKSLTSKEMVEKTKIQPSITVNRQIDDLKNTSQAHQYFLKGKNYYQRYLKQDNKIAIEFFKHALKLEPNLAEAYSGLADAYSQGVFQFEEDDSWRGLALNSAISAVKLAPESETAYKALGLAEYLNGQLYEAITANLKAVEINPKFLPANTNLAFIYRELGQLDKAFEWNFKTIEIDPFYAPGYLHLAQSYQAQGKLDLAERNFLKALELKPDYQLAIKAYKQFLKKYRKSV